MISRAPSVARRGAGAAALLVCLAGCSAPSPEQAPPASVDAPLAEVVDARVLHEGRTPYLGDNSRVVALVDAVGVRALGERTVELSTDEPPYALTIRFASLAPGVADDGVADAMTDRALLLLATIDNLDEVRWELPEGAGDSRVGSVTRAEGDEIAGAPLGELASEEDLRGLVRALGV